MKIIFTELTRKWILTIPVVPEEFVITKKRKREVLEGINKDIDVTGTLDLRDFTIDSFIPNKGNLEGKKYPFALTSTKGVNVLNAMNYWIDNDEPLRMVVTSKYGNTLLNVIVKVVELTHKSDKASDFVYTLSLAEHVPLSGV